jgi:hypothetical protein
MTNLQIANTIIEQLGGSQFIVMTGSKDLVGREDGLSFRIGRNAKGISHIRITLEVTDTYTVEFFKWRKLEMISRGDVSAVYADQLRKVIESRTGLITSLGTMRRA